ncbi:MAG: hypothetical protein KME52_11630 [Desmonostoc geniculatum HA4340-LM1]|nr:hypothetical protein [Desmonostoc geniculatum HA4340-LM1]
MGHWAWGIGHGVWGIGHGALGMGHEASERGCAIHILQIFLSIVSGCINLSQIDSPEG